MTSELNLKRPERARNKGSTKPERLDDTRCTTYNISSCKVDGGGIKDKGYAIEIHGFWIRDWKLGIRVQGSGFRVQS